MDANHEYYPLNSGKLIVVDKSTGLASAMDGKIYSDLEVIRHIQEVNFGLQDQMELLEKYVWWESVVKLEHSVGAEKVNLGEFRETGLYRGEIADPNFEDTMT